MALSAEMLAVIASPCCHAHVVDMRCTECGAAFDAVGGNPVLVNFSQSVLDRASVIQSEAASPIQRSRGGRFRQLLAGTNPVAARNAVEIRRRLPAGARILVVGGATIGKGLEALYDGRFEVVSFDIYASNHTDLVADAHRIPFQDSVFDGVIIQAVLEHVLDPWLVVAEIWRVLRPDGIVYAETPFLQQVHEGPYDFTRFTESGHRWLFKNFSLIDSGVVAGPGYQLLWSIDYTVRALARSRRAGLRARKLAVAVRLLDRFVDYRYAIDAASAVFFLGQRADMPISPHEAVTHYQGAQ